MKKRFAVVLCAALCVSLLIAGCGAGKEEQQETLVFEGAKKVETEPEELVEPKPEEEPEAQEPATEPGEESEEEEIIEEIADDVVNNSLFAFEMENPVIYDAEGVTVTMDEWNWNSETDFLVLVFTMENNNTDNKKVTFEATVNIDGFSFDYFRISGLAVGESQTKQVSGFLTHNFELKELINADSMLIESLSIHYLSQIGSDGEKIPGHIVFSNPEFTDAAFAQIYGGKIDEFDYDRDRNGTSDITYEVYVKHTENNYTLVTMKVANSVDLTSGLYYPGIDVSINDKICNNTLLRLGSEMSDNGDMMCAVYDTPENIRNEMEISNDVPLEGYIRTGMYRGKEEITIPAILE